MPVGAGCGLEQVLVRSGVSATTGLRHDVHGWSPVLLRSPGRSTVSKVPECKDTRLYEDLSDETWVILRHSVASSLDTEGRRQRRVTPDQGGREGPKLQVTNVENRRKSRVQAKLAAANCPVPMMPLRSSMTLRSWGLVAVFMASWRSMVPSASSVTRDWSKVSIP